MAVRKEVFGVTIDGDITGLKSAMNEAVKVFNSTERALKNVNKQLQLDPTNVDTIRTKQELLSKAIVEGEQALKKLKDVREDIVNDKNFAKGTDELQEKFTELNLKIAQQEDKLKQLKKEFRNMPSPEIEAFANKLDKVGNTLTDISQKTRGLSLAMAGLMTASFNSAVSYENSIADIKRVVSDLSDNTIAKLKDIAIETGTAFGDVSEYATFAGALGLAEDKVADFTKTMIDLNTATGGAFNGEEGAKSIVVFLNALGLGVEQAEAFGSAIAIVGDKYADIGDETLQIATNLSGLATIANVSQYDLIGLAGVMANLGLTGEAASSGITRAFVQIEKALAGGEEDIEDFAKASGMSAKEFIEAWKEKPLETFMRFTDGLKSDVFNNINTAISTSSDKVQEFADILGMTAEEFKGEWVKDAGHVFDLLSEKMEDMDDSGVEAVSTLTGVELTSIRTIQTLLRLAGQGQEVANAVQLANEAWNENTALQEKANGIYDTTERKLQGLFESLKQTGALLVDGVLPTVKDGIDLLNKALKRFNELSPTVKNTVLALMGVGAVISPITGTLGAIDKQIANLLRHGGVFNVLFPETKQALGKDAVNILKEFNKPISTAGVVGAIGGITVALAGLAYYAYENNPVRLLKESCKELNDTLEDSIIQSDSLYNSNVKQIESVGFYADKVDRLNEELKNTSLTEEMRQDIQNKIIEYLGELNEALGSEVFYFDTTNGKISAQGEEIEEVKSKFDELAFTAKKQAWLDAHKDTLTQAYTNLDEANSMMNEATTNFVNKVNDIPRDYIALFEEVEGDLDSFDSKLQEKGLPRLDLSEMASLQNAWKDYVTSMQEAQTVAENAQLAIQNYEQVSQSTMENFGSIVQTIAEQTTVSKDSTLGIAENLDLVNQKINAVKGSLDEAQETNNGYLSTLENQRETLEKQKGILEQQLEFENSKAEAIFKTLEKQTEENAKTEESRELYEKRNKLVEDLLLLNDTQIEDEQTKLNIEKQKKDKLEEIIKVEQSISSQEKEFIDYWNNWTPPTKTLTVVLETQGSLPNISNSGGYGMRGNGVRSAGFGELLSNAMAMISGTMNNYRSGGFNSGGITLNANFNVSSQNVGREQVRMWSKWLVDDINTELGRQI